MAASTDIAIAITVNVVRANQLIGRFLYQCREVGI